MNDLFIRRLDLDWDRVEERSYLRRIPALQGLRSLEFTAPITLFVGENGTGKSTLLEAIAGPSTLPRDTAGQRAGIFSGRKAFIT